MTIYYVILDYNGWVPYIALDGKFYYSKGYEPFCYSSTCLENVEKICTILNKRNVE